ncbi:alkaline phosphatase family protein [Actinoplanes sp. CA-030573]|uniref:alkaline phosphatase family protein n=1 Tax=Actinoplanes sp. CA-030573 TaxID=3239898 RepID=UPI003D9426BF
MTVKARVTRWAPAGWAVAWLAVMAWHGGLAWHFFTQGARALADLDDPAGGLHLYAAAPALQIGPLAFLVTVFLRILGGGPALLAAQALGVAAGAYLLWQAGRLGGRISPWAVVFFVPAWMYLAVASTHVDDVLALGGGVAALAAARAHRAWAAGLLLGLAVDAKPWALGFAALLVLLPDRRATLRGALAAAGTIAVAWLPFFLADPRTVRALHFTIVNTPLSALRALGVTDPRTPPWDRPAQMLLGIALGVLAVRRGRWAAIPLLAVAARIALDPGTNKYYAAGAVVGAVLWDAVGSEARFPWWTAGAAVSLFAGRSMPMPPAAHGWFTLVYCVACVFLAAPGRRHDGPEETLKTRDVRRCRRHLPNARGGPAVNPELLDTGGTRFTDHRKGSEMFRPAIGAVAVLGLLAATPATAAPARAHPSSTSHVLLLSIDGLHQQDLDWYVRTHPRSSLARLVSSGTGYRNAVTPFPSDSFPGMLAQVTGGDPRTAVFGMNFQTVSTAQKLPISDGQAGGYRADGRTPGPVLAAAALDFVDAQLGRLSAELARQHLADRTTIILSAKHGQSPTDPAQLTRINDGAMLMWLADRSPAAAAFAQRFLPGHDGTGNDITGAAKPYTASGLAHVYSGAAAAGFIGVRPGDERVPDLIGIAQPGVVYTAKKSKIAEHGGNTPADRHVPIVVAGAGIAHHTVDAPVETTQIAPTILRLLPPRPGRAGRRPRPAHPAAPPLSRRGVRAVSPAAIHPFGHVAGRAAARRRSGSPTAPRSRPG